MAKPKEILASKVERLQRELVECAHDSDELFQAAHSAYLESQENARQCQKLLRR
jgi:hypothetical protein